MNILYAKTALYAYPHLQSVANKIDEIILERALGSISDFSSALTQCEKIIALTNQKRLCLQLKDILDKVLKDFSEQDKICLDYRYFKKMKKEDYGDYDFFGRAYFRKQERLLLRISSNLVKEGITDEYFTQNHLKTDYFSRIYKKVLRLEKAFCKKKKYDDGCIEQKRAS